MATRLADTNLALCSSRAQSRPLLLLTAKIIVLTTRVRPRRVPRTTYEQSQKSARPQGAPNQRQNALEMREILPSESVIGPALDSFGTNKGLSTPLLKLLQQAPMRVVILGT